MPLIPIIAQLVGAGGLPVVAKLLGTILSKKDGALAEAGKLLLENPVEIEKQLSGKDNMKIALRELDLDSEKLQATISQTEQVNRTFRREIATKDKYTSRWRPTLGYCVCFVWSVQMLSASYVMVSDPEVFTQMVAAMTALSFMWGMVFSVLGINVWSRSIDKKNQVLLDSGSLPASIIEKLASNFTGKK